MSGSRLAAVCRTAVCLVLSALLSAPAGAKSYSEVAGTVFRDPGLALPGATVVLFLEGTVKNKKLQQTETNDRGEFLFRVAGVGSIYLVVASMKGFGPQQKEAEIHSGDEHIDVNLVLSPVKK
jgi:Carboxypeptidase regulatory-like domain